MDKKIEKGIPPPEYTRGDHDKLLMKMVAGDSVFFDGKNRQLNRVNSLGTRAGKLGIEITTSAVKENGKAGIRFWVLKTPFNGKKG